MALIPLLLVGFTLPSFGSRRRMQEESRFLLGLARGTLLLIDDRGVVRFANPPFVDLFGFPSSEAVGRPVLEFIAPESEAAFREFTTRASTGDPGPVLEIQGLRKDGSRVALQATGHSTTIRGTRVFGVHLRDMTDRDELVQALADRAAELARSNRDLEQFAYVASHDLQEPLRMVGSYTQLIRQRYRGKVLDGDAEEFLNYALEGATRMRVMIENLLAYSRLGTQGNPFKPLSMEEVFDVAVRNLSGPIAEAGASVSHGSLPRLEGDFSQLVQLLQNLIGNALKFHGSEAARVRVEAKRSGPDWVISVQDNGIGIAPEYKDRIFVIFQRLHSREEYPGSGIGLSTCKKVVERHGGHIWVESQGQPGFGSVFYFTLPADRRVVAVPVKPERVGPKTERAEQARTLIEERLAELI